MVILTRHGFLIAITQKFVFLVSLFRMPSDITKAFNIPCAKYENCLNSNCM